MTIKDIKDKELYINKAREAEKKYNIPENTLVGLLAQESGHFNKDVISGKKKSYAGAIGIGQFMPKTAQFYKIDPLNVDQAIDASAKYLASSFNTFKNWDDAILSYNAGVGRVKEYKAGKPIKIKEHSEYVGRVKNQINRYGAGKLTNPKENITPELTDFDFTPQTATFALEDSNVEEEDAPKEEDKSKEVEQAKEVLKEEQFMSDMFKGKITPIQLAQEEAPQQAPQSNLLESFSNIESFVDTPLAQQGLTVPRKKMSLEELDAKMKQTRALLDKGKVQQSNLKERPKEVVRESTQTTFRNETGRQVNTNPNQQISTKHVNERRTESQIIADRKKAVEERQKADKDWLTNWYANRVIPNERLQELYLEDKDIYNERMKNVPTVTNVESIDNNPYITGRYNSENGQILMTPKSRDNVYLHEVTHYSDDFPSAMRTAHNQVVGLNKAPKELTQGIYNEKYDYFTDSDEVHARIQVLRKEAGITPEQNVTKEYLDKFLKDYKGDNENINDLLNIADPPHLLEMLNYMASNKDKTIKKGQLAQEGGYTEEEQRFITEYFQQGGIIKDNDKIEIKPSKIEGNGIFVTRDLKKGSSIGLAHTNNQPSTELGKFHNHSENPNSESFKIDNNRFIIALRDLKKGEEVTVDYRKQPELEQPSDFKK